MSNLNWPPERTVTYKLVSKEECELVIPLYNNEKANNLEEKSK